MSSKSISCLYEAFREPLRHITSENAQILTRGEAALATLPLHCKHVDVRSPFSDIKRLSTYSPPSNIFPITSQPCPLRVRVRIISPSTQNHLCPPCTLRHLGYLLLSLLNKIHFPLSPTSQKPRILLELASTTIPFRPSGTRQPSTPLNKLMVIYRPCHSVYRDSFCFLASLNAQWTLCSLLPISPLCSY